MKIFSFLNCQCGRSPFKKKSSSKFSSFSTCVRQQSISSTNSSTSSSKANNKNFEPTMEELRWASEKFDTNKDGKISQEEYKSVLWILDPEMAHGEIAKTFKVLDSNGDGFGDFKEFAEMFDVGSGGVKESDLESAFRLLDVDGDGKVSAEGLSKVMKQSLERVAALGLVGTW